MKLYDELAPWFHLLTAPNDYAEEAELYRGLLRAACSGTAETLLELGSGGGNNAFHLKRDFQCTLTDLSPAMLEVSKTINPECDHIVGDMRTLRLGRTFDLVFVHDAVTYLVNEEELRAAAETAFIHTRPGGAALFAPDETTESFQGGTESGGHDDGDRSLRYLMWSTDPDPNDSTCDVDFAVMLREGTEPTRAIHDHHTCGLFPRATWLRWHRDPERLADHRGALTDDLVADHADEPALLDPEHGPGRAIRGATGRRHPFHLRHQHHTFAVDVTLRAEPDDGSAEHHRRVAPAPGNGAVFKR